MKRLIAGCMALAFLLAGCSKTSEDPNSSAPLYKDGAVLAATDKASDEAIRKNYSKFVFDLAGRCAEQSDGNILISSDSILFALEMTAAGAAGTTQSQMLDVLVPGANTTDALVFGVSHYNELQNKSIGIANSVWLSKTKASDVKSDFVDFTKNNFDARVESIDFDSSGVETINNWVNENTKGRIPTILSNGDVDDQTFAVLVNAIAFDGTWDKSFNSSDEDYFNYTDGTNALTTYLYGTEDIYIQSSDATGFIKPYSDGKFAFMAILPNDETMTGSDYLCSMTSDSYWELWDSREESSEVRVMLPIFTNEYSVELSSTLKEMGMTEAFLGGDFSNMTDTDIEIDKVIHKTFIDVNEEGTSAAAATAVTARVASIGPMSSLSVYCNRPFVYAIVDLDTGLPVFLGTFDYVS